MKSFKPLLLIAAVIAVLPSMTAHAAEIDMNDPRRALGRQDDVRVDAQLLQETITPGTPIGVTYQVQNLTSAPIAVADKVAEASYDPDSRTITLSLGSEVPLDGNVPRLVTIAPGEKKVFRAAAVAAMSATELRARRGSGSGYLRMKVSILRNLEPFKALLGGESRPQPLPDELFDTWFESSDTIFLNALPVQFSPSSVNRGMSAAERGGSRGY